MVARGFRCAPFGTLNVSLWDTAPFLLLWKSLADFANRAKNSDFIAKSQNLIKIAESALNSSLRVSEASVAIHNTDSANLDSATRTGIFANTLSLRDSAFNAESWQSKSICHFEQSEKSLFRFCDSANLSPKPISKSLIFSQKGCTPHPAPPTRQKLPLFAFRGSASLSPLLAKNRHSHYCSFAPDFLHHEAGEIKGASHELDFNLDCHDLTSSNLAMTKKIQKNAESSTESQNLNAESNSQITHPLRHPSAREGERFDSNSAREGDFWIATKSHLNARLLAMTEKIQKNAESSTESQNLNAESNTKNTHPLTPSAREGEQKAKTSAREGEQIAESATKTQNPKITFKELK
ncbi:hypothetical protein ACWIUD_01680 [Helicobacter sp. 23-1044]